jgi:hypothetical protein
MAPQIPHSSEGIMTARSSFLLAFGTNVTQFVDKGRRRQELVNVQIL